MKHDVLSSLLTNSSEDPYLYCRQAGRLSMKAAISDIIRPFNVSCRRSHRDTALLKAVCGKMFFRDLQPVKHFRVRFRPDAGNGRSRKM